MWQCKDKPKSLKTSQYSFTAFSKVAFLIQFFITTRRDEKNTLNALPTPPPCNPVFDRLKGGCHPSTPYLPLPQ